MNSVASRDVHVAGTTRLNRLSALGLAERFGILAIFVAIFVAFAIAQPETFLSAGNLRAIVSSQSVVAVVALGLMVPLVAGDFDLSVGTVAVAGSIVAATTMADGWALLPACGLTLLFGAVCGAVNGALVAYGGLNGLIATLGSATVLTGLISWHTHDLSISEGISPALSDLGTKNVLGVPGLALVAVAAALVVAYLMMATPFGRKLAAVGSSRAAAQLVGVRVRRMVFISFVCSALLGSLAGLLLVAQQGSGNPALSGFTLLLPALAAVYLGASAFLPGEFNVPGTVLGLLLVAVLVSGLTLAGAAAWVQSVVQGMALIIAVGTSSALRRRRMGADM
ncbi:MAG: ABC transporter permease [Actinobacteria bacterium]|nr:ABC transporter permease [Actinomycetota bacterium]